jgi:prephenate dehydratase
VWGAGAIAISAYSFEEVVDAVAKGRADAGVLPVENAIVGPVPQSLRALKACPAVHVVGETVVSVDLALMAIPGVAIEDVRHVSSHPVALAQCTQWFASRPHIATVSVYDTAGAACMLAEHRDTRGGAIAGVAAAARYGLHVLDDRVANRTDNTTRFVVIARPAVVGPT